MKRRGTDSEGNARMEERFRECIIRLTTSYSLSPATNSSMPVDVVEKRVTVRSPQTNTSTADSHPVQCGATGDWLRRL